jgi:ABC-type lipoprotein release transport system permease subunit
VLYPKSKLTPAVDIAQLIGITLAVLGPFALLSVVPAWKAASADPVEAMRG